MCRKRLALCGFVLGGLALLTWSSSADEPAAVPAGVTTLKGHTEAVYAVAFSPDGGYVATGSFDKTLKLWDAATGKEVKTLGGPGGHQNLVLSTAFSPDGQMLASGSTDNTAKLWDVPGRKPLREFDYPEAVHGLALSADGLRLAATGQDGHVTVWTTADGKLLQKLVGSGKPLTTVAFNANPNPAAQVVAAGGPDQALRVWNPTTGQPLGAVTTGSPITGVAIHPNNTVAYTAAEDGTLKFWQLPLTMSRIAPPQGDVVTALALAPDGNQVVSGGADKTVRITNVADTKQLQQLTGPAAAVLSVASSPNVIAAGTQDQRLFLWNPRDGKLMYQAVAHAGPVTGVAFPQANQLLTAGSDGVVKVWAMPPVPARVLTHPDGVFAAAITAGGKSLVTGGADKIVRIWNLTNQQVERQLSGHAAAVTAVAASGNGQVLVSGSADQTIRSWDPANGKVKAVLGAHDGPVTSLALNAAGTQALSASLDGTVKLWNLAAPAAKLFSHGDQVTSVALSPDGNLLLTGCTDKQVRLWNLGTGKMDRTFAGNTLAVTAVAFGGNGALVTAGGADKSLTVWNTADAKEVKKFANLPAAVLSVAVDPAAKLPAVQVAAGLADNTIRLFDLAQGKELKTLKGHTGAVNAVAFLPKGDQLITASADGTAQVWGLADGAPKVKLEYGSPVACLALTKDGSRVAVGGAGKAVKVWTLADAKPAATITTPAEVRSVTFSADGSRLVVGGSDNLARVYGADGKLVEFFPQEGAVSAVAFHPDGKQVIAAGADKTARVWSSSLAWMAAQAGPVRQAIFNAKGDQVISAGDDKTIKIWNAADGKPVKGFAAHDGPVFGLVVSPDGTKILSAGADNQVKVWSTAAPKPGAKAEEKPVQVIALAGPPQSLALSPNGARLAVALQDKTTTTVSVFDLATGKVLLSVPDQAGRIRALAFEGDNRTLVSAGEDKTARLTDVGVVGMFDAHAGGVTALAVHSNGTQALTGGADKTVKLWNLPGAKEAAVVRTFGPLADPVTAVAFSRDYTQVGAAAGKVVKVWTVADSKEVLTLTHPTAVLSVSFSPDKTKIATGAEDTWARVWDVAAGKELQAFPLLGPVRSIVFHNNNNTVISGSTKTVGFHTISAQRVIAAAAGPIRALAITPNGSHVLTGDGKEVKLWNTGNGAKEPRTFTGAGEVRAIAVSKNGVLVATGGADQTVRVFTFADGKPLGQFPAAGPIRDLAFSPNNQSLTACADKSLQTWHVAYNPGQPPPADFGRSGQTYGHDAAATAVVYAPDSMHFYSAGLDKKVRVWKFAADAPVKSLGHPNFVDAVAFNQTGTQLATGCHDGSVRIWDVAKGTLVREIKAHAPPPSNAVYCIAWSPDGKQIVSGSLDHSLKLWDATSGQMVREFKGYKEKEFEKGHRDGVFAVAFSPDGKRIASGSSDHTIKFWNVADGNVIRECINPKLKSAAPAGEPPQAHPGWVYSLRFTSDGKTLVSAGNAARNHGYLALWEAADGKFIYGEELPLGAVYSVAVAPDGKHLALACGPRGRQAQDANGYILKMPESEKKGP
jgi:WD40 repeat protein